MYTYNGGKAETAVRPVSGKVSYEGRTLRSCQKRREKPQDTSLGSSTAANSTLSTDQRTIRPQFRRSTSVQSTDIPARYALTSVNKHSIEPRTAADITGASHHTDETKASRVWVMAAAAHLAE